MGLAGAGSVGASCGRVEGIGYAGTHGTGGDELPVRSVAVVTWWRLRAPPRHSFFFCSHVRNAELSFADVAGAPSMRMGALRLRTGTAFAQGTAGARVGSPGKAAKLMMRRTLLALKSIMEMPYFPVFNWISMADLTCASVSSGVWVRQLDLISRRKTLRAATMLVTGVPN